jgi:hypothetical protein
MVYTPEEEKFIFQRVRKMQNAGIATHKAIEIAEIDLKNLKRRNAHENAVPMPPFMRKMGFKL